MCQSRRQFLQGSLAAAGAMALGSAAGCDRASARRRPAGSTAELPRAPRGFVPSYIRAEREGRLARVEKELWKLYDHSRCCPRKCDKRRTWGEVGVCKSTSVLKVHSAGPHFGEERPLVGENGSGTIFFSQCNLLCCFCQNWEIAHRGDGRLVTHEGLARTMLDLQQLGCHNINLVTPTHMVPNIIRALRIAIREGLRLPLVYNTGGYDNIQVIRRLAGIVDIYMPDFKFMDAGRAARYLHKCADYPWVAAEVIKEMHRQVGLLKVDERGVAKRGLIIRHLVMPGNVAGTDRFVKWVAQEISPHTFVNLMDQYHPAHQAFRHPEIARRLTGEEWARAAQWAMDAGLTHWRG